MSSPSPHLGPYLGVAEIRQLLDELEIRPTKSKGQNFVHDPGVVRRIVSLAQVRPGERVVEVGPGLGSLTLGLLEAGAQVEAVELDVKLAAALPATVGSKQPQALERLRVHAADALQVRSLQDPQALVANLPYNVSVPVLLHFLETFPTLERALVMVQSEVAQRLAATPGSRIYGAPSVKMAWYGTTTKAGRVGRNVFFPVPNVDSDLVRWTRHRDPLPLAARAAVFAVVDAAFAQRRKTLRAALAGWAGSPARAESILKAAGVDPSLRGEALGVEEFTRIAAAAEAGEKSA